MADLNAKLARQQQALLATKTSIANLQKLVNASKDETFRINGNLLLAQLRTKLTRQSRAVQLTQWAAQLSLDLQAIQDGNDLGPKLGKSH